MELTLCPPAIVYLAFSTVVLILFVVQNVGNSHVYCLGDQQCDVENNKTILLVKILYILLFTLILNSICNLVDPFFSWILVIIGILIFFLAMVSFILLHSKSYINLFTI